MCTCTEWFILVVRGSPNVSPPHPLCVGSHKVHKAFEEDLWDSEYTELLVLTGNVCSSVVCVRVHVSNMSV